MVFAPKETAASIGWENRSNKDKSQKRNGRRKKVQPHLSKDADSDNNTTASKKRARTALHGEFSGFGKESESIAINENNVLTEVDVGYYGPQFPNISRDDCQPLTNRKKIHASPTSQDFKVETSEDSFTNVITFDSSKNLRPQRLAINGRAKVEVIEGEIDILGYRLSSSSSKTSVTIDSPSWMSAICIEPLQLQNMDDSLDKDPPKQTTITPTIQISSLSTDICTYEISSPLETRSITITEKWKSISTEIIENNTEDPGQSKSKILVCGAKSTGKSTYVRYLVNRQLSGANPAENGTTLRKIAILDCDVGQPEFSTPGIVSLTVVSQPILSPPHAHIVTSNNNEDAFSLAKKHERCYFYGFTTSKANPVRYMKCIKSLLKDIDELYKESGFCGLVVNTDGWVKGMGFEVLSTLIDAVEPNHIVQILGGTKAKFFDLAPHVKENRKIHVVELAGGKIYDPFSPTSPPLSRAPSLASMQSLQDQSMTDLSLPDNLTSIASSETRNLRFVTYFLGGYEAFLSSGATFDSGGICDDNSNIALKLSMMKPYMVPFDSIHCSVLNEDGRECGVNDDTWYHELNASIVSLCGSDSSSDRIRTCYGLGFVRSIDVSRRIIYVLTPVDAITLQMNVKAMVKGQFQLPSEGLYCGFLSESFSFMSFDGTLVGIGNELMKPKNAGSRR